MQQPSTPEQSEFRHDLISGRWVIFAPERARRPMGLSHVKPEGRVNVERAVCPFCPGPDHDIPDPVYVMPSADNWEVLVCPNKFPAVRPIAPDTHGLTSRFNTNQLPGFGMHEVVVEGRMHRIDPIELPLEVYQQVLIAYRERIKVFAADVRMDYVSVFKNIGAEAGASMAHCHSQLIATPFIPNTIRDELRGAEDYFKKRDRCAFCRLAMPHKEGSDRIIAESANFVILCPFAPRFAYEIWVMPRTHTSHYETISDELAKELAQVLSRTLLALDKVASTPAINYYLHSAPMRAVPSPSYHWHIEIVPRTARPAGFEWSTGVFINTVMPERAARELRAVIKEH
jgi:UDPglucose--hexose-1-phosphate uridylyltransferase